MDLTKRQFARIREIDRLLRNRKYPNCLRLSVDWELSQKTIQRDINFMRDEQGAPIEYDRKHGGYCYTDENWFLPSLSLSEGDLVALLVGTKALENYRGTPVATRLEHVFAKLAEQLPERISLEPEMIHTRFSFAGPPAKAVDEKIWTVVVRALLNHRALDITYHSMNSNKDTNRVIEPYHMANLAGEWYVFAWCRKTDMLIQFAIPRIKKARLTDERYVVPADFDIEQQLSTAFGRFVLSDKTVRVRLLFDSDVAPRVLDRQWRPEQETKIRKSGDVELSFEIGGLVEVFHWVLSWGHHIKVLGPKKLKDWVDEEIKMMSKNCK